MTHSIAPGGAIHGIKKQELLYIVVELIYACFACIFSFFSIFFFFFTVFFFHWFLAWFCQNIRTVGFFSKPTVHNWAGLLYFPPLLCIATNPFMPLALIKCWFLKIENRPENHPWKLPGTCFPITTNFTNWQMDKIPNMWPKSLRKNDANFFYTFNAISRILVHVL